MGLDVFYRLGACILIFGVCLFSYLDKRNQLTQRRMRLPALRKEVLALREEIKKLEYEAERFESPMHLMELARLPQYGHLKHPLVRDILTVPEAVAQICEEKDEEKAQSYYSPKVTMAMGVNR